MSNTLGSLNEADIRQLASLIETLEDSTFDFLQLEIGDLKVTIGKGDVPLSPGAPATSSAPPPAAPPTRAAAPSPNPAAAPAPPAQPAAQTAPLEGTVEITAPLLGMFYAQSEPGAPPFVTVGTEVSEDTTVALVEVMKTFNAVPAGRAGIIAEICVQNAQMVEFGQVLFRLRPKS